MSLGQVASGLHPFFAVSGKATNGPLPYVSIPVRHQQLFLEPCYKHTEVGAKLSLEDVKIDLDLERVFGLCSYYLAGSPPGIIG